MPVSFVPPGTVYPPPVQSWTSWPPPSGAGCCAWAAGVMAPANIKAMKQRWSLEISTREFDIVSGKPRPYRKLSDADKFSRDQLRSSSQRIEPHRQFRLLYHSFASASGRPFDA